MVWNEGYVSEINYTYGFYSELSPARLAYASVIKSNRPPRINQNFTYCELACGHGFSTNLLAATYPQAQFYANDFNPNHIAEAKSLAEEGKLKNMHFFDDSFQQFLDRDLPDFDFICLHGIYSWISPENRQAIVKFIERKLKVGGMVYISYNALPGWAAAMPIRELIKRHGEKTSGPIIERINQALNFGGELLEANAAYFKQSPSLKTRFERLKEQNRHYLAHEYFCQDWHPLFFDQVAQDLERAKLSFVASANITDLIDVVNLTQAAQQKLNTISDPIYREVVRDYFLNTQFRRDIFARGKLPLTPQQQTEQFKQTRFVMAVPRSKIQLKQQFPLGEVTLEESVYSPVCDVLASGIFTLGQLQTHELTSHIPLNNLFQILLVLSALGYVYPAVDQQTLQKRKPFTDAFNIAVMTRTLSSNDYNYLAAPLIGTGIALNRLEQLFLMAKIHNQDLAEFTWKVLASQNQRLIKEGQELTTPEENIAHLKEKAEEFSRDWLLILQTLGIA